MALRRGLFLGAFVALAVGCGGGGSAVDGGDADAGCVSGRACNPTCTKTSQCGIDEVCTGGFCGAKVPTSANYASCSMDGDCARGDYCTLGVCSHDCLSDKDCDGTDGGTTCTDRGRCVAAQVVGQPAPTTLPSKGTPKLDPTSLSFVNQAQTTATVALSNLGGEPFDFRVVSSSPAFTVTPFEGRVSGQPVTLTVTLDRSALGGSDTAFLMVNTTGGSRRLPISVASTINGTWTGTFFVESPVALGQHAASFNLATDLAGKVSGVVLGETSTLWPVNAAITGSTGTSGGIQTVSFSFRMVAPQGTAANPGVPGTLERIITVNGQRGPGGAIEGTFVEAVHGLAGAGVDISGKAFLRRSSTTVSATPVADSPTTVGPVADPYVDDAGTPTAAYASCPTQCPGACSATDTLGNANAYLTFATTGSLRPSMLFYSEFANDPAPFQTADTCVNNPSSAGCSTRQAFDSFFLYCAQFWDAKGIRGGAGAGMGPNFLDTLEVSADHALYEGNAAIAMAFDDYYAQSGSLSAQESKLATANAALLAGLYSTTQNPIAFADPGIATYVNQLPAAALANSLGTTTQDTGTRGTGEQLRRALLVINNLLFVADQRSYILRRQGSDDVATQRVRDAALTGYLAVEALGPALAKSTAWDIELASTKTNWHQLLTDFTDIAQGRDAFGYAPGFVPFYWNKDATGTNYMQIKATADTFLGTWKTSHDQAASSSRTFEAQAQQLAGEKTQELNTTTTQFHEVCGASATSLSDCGADYSTSKPASLLAQARLDFDGSVNRVHEASLQISNLYQEIKIEQDRAAKVANVHENNALLISDTGAKVNLLDQKAGQISAMQQFDDDLLTTAQEAGSGSAWAPAAAAFGIAKAVINLACNEAKLDLQKQKDQLQVDERSKVEFSYAQVELINSAAVVADKNLQIDTLMIELAIAYNNLAQSQARLDAVYQKAQSLLDTQARNAALIGANGKQALNMRVFANNLQLQAARDERLAFQWAYLATRALEYQLNVSLDQSTLWKARTPTELTTYMNSVLVVAAASAGSAQTRTDVISLRDKILGLNTPIKDVATGAVVSAQQRFRQFVMNPRNRDENGNFHIHFVTDEDANPIFSSLFGSDRIRSIKMNLIGDNLGTGVTSAQVQLVHGGTSYLRATARDSSGTAPLTAYDVSGKSNQPRLAIVQAGINAAAGTLPEDIELQERAVLAGPWQLIIDQSTATPANAKLNLAGLDDIEITFIHDAYTIQ